MKPHQGNVQHIFYISFVFFDTKPVWMECTVLHVLFSRTIWVEKSFAVCQSVTRVTFTKLQQSMRNLLKEKLQSICFVSSVLKILSRYLRPKISILCQLNEERKQKIENNRHGIIQIMKLLHRLKLGGQNIAIRGKTDSRSNFNVFFKTKRSMI